MSEEDQPLTEAESAAIAEFARRAEAERLRELGLSAPDTGDDEETPPPPRESASLVERLAAVIEADGTPLLRTDFSDDDAWSKVVDEVSRPRHFPGAVDHYEPRVTAFDERAFEGATGESLAELAARGSLRGYAVVADAQSMAEAAGGDDITVVYVDLSVEDDDDPELQVTDSYLGRTFRCAVEELASIEANLAIANLSFGEFADQVGADGVFRSFE